MNMKLLIALLLFSSSAMTAELPACYTGAWYDAERVGEGMFLEVLDGDVFTGSFYTYHELTPDWFIFEGIKNDLVLSTGRKISENPFKIVEHKVGVGSILPVTDDLFIFTWKKDIDYWGKPCLSQCDGQMVYTRITSPVKCLDAEPK